MYLKPHGTATINNRKTEWHMILEYAETHNADQKKNHSEQRKKSFLGVPRSICLFPEAEKELHIYRRITGILQNIIVK